MDEDVGYLRFRRFDQSNGHWEPPQILFLEELLVQDFLRACWSRRCDWLDPTLAADGADWVFEGSGWSAYRHSPEPGDPWHDIGLKFLALADLQIPADEIY